MTKSNKIFLIVTFLILTFISFMISIGSKTSLGVIIAMLFVVTYIVWISKLGFEGGNKYLLYLIIFTIPFPYLIQFMEKDALTITTLLIYILFSVIVLDHIFQKKRVILEPKFSFILPILIFVSLTVSLILNPSFIGQSIRHYIANVSAILLYFAILATIKKQSDVVMIIKIIVSILVLQSGISFLQWKFPNTVNYLIHFRTRVFIPDVYIVGGFVRVTGTIWDYELLAEWFLVGAILSMFLIYEKSKYLYYFPLFCCMAGIVFTKTRSGMLLLPFAVGVICLLLKVFKKDHKGTSTKIVLSIILGCGILTFMFPNQISEAAHRLGVYFHSSQLFSLEAINRKETWENATYLFFKNPTIFGMGLYNVKSLYSWSGSFHSLYLTILYKIGILGIVIYAIFWLGMLTKAWHSLVSMRKRKNWYVTFFLFIALIIMLINETKIEYLRYSHTIQFAWLIYALLIVSLRQSERVEKDEKSVENIMVPKTSI